MVKLNKKSQDMPINIIIIVALALMALVVLTIIFTSQTRKAVLTLESCAGIGGKCTDTGKSCLSDTEFEKNDAKCPDPKQKCCIKVLV